MINGKKILALIPARGGSKGIKNKNIAKFYGKPLISYTILAANKSRYIDETIVTTDSEKIKAIAEQYGAHVPFLRPAELATDTAKTLDAVRHSIKTLEKMGKRFDILVLLQPTSPLRTVDDIDGAILEFDKRGNLPLASVSEVSDHPLLIRSINKKNELEHLISPEKGSTMRRQDMLSYYRVNGSIYINLIKEINKETSFNDNRVPYIMQWKNSADIDNMLDFMIAEYLFKQHN